MSFALLRYRGSPICALAIVLAAMIGTIAESSAEGELEKLELKFRIEDEKLRKPLDQLREGYKKHLAKLQKEFGSNGDLNGVLATKAAAEAGDPEPDKLAEIPKLAEVQRLYLAEKEKRSKENKQSALKLRNSFITDLLALEKKLTGEGKSVQAVAVDAKIQELKKELTEPKPVDKPEIEFVEDLKMIGRFYCTVNSSATFYINGKKVYGAKRGNSKSEPVELEVGDNVVFTARNRDGGRKWFKTAFMSDDKAYVISFNTKNLKVIDDGEKRRSFTKLELERVTTFSNARTPDAKDAIPFENESEWVWEHGGLAILTTIITPEMIHATGEAPQE